MAEGISKAIGPNTILGRTVKWISDIFYGLGGILGSLGKLISGDVMGALNDLWNSFLSIIGFGFGGGGLKDSRNTDTANRSIDSFAKALDEGTRSITKSVEDVRKESFGSASTTGTIAKAFESQSKPLKQFANESLSELKELGLADVGDYLKSLKDSSNLDRPRIFNTIKNLASEGKLSSQEMTKATNALRTYIENSKKLDMLTQAKEEQKKFINVGDEAREQLQIVAQKFAQGQARPEELAKKIWDFPNLARLNGSQAIDQTMKAILEVTKDGDVGNFITDKKQMGILGASLTWEQKQAMLLEEANKYHKEAAKYQREGKVNEMVQAFQAALSAQAALEQAKRFKTVSAGIQGQLALTTPTSANTNIDSLPKETQKEFDNFRVGNRRLTGSGGNKPSGGFGYLTDESVKLLEETARGEGEVAKAGLTDVERKQLISQATRLLTQARVSNIARTTPTADVLVGTVEERSKQMVEIWRNALTIPEQLSLESARLITSAQSQLEKTAIADGTFNDLMKKMQDRIRKGKQTEEDIAKSNEFDSNKKKLLDQEKIDLSRDLNKLASQAAGIQAAKLQKTTPQQEAAAAIEVVTGSGGKALTNRQISFEQLAFYEKELPVLVKNALSGKSAQQGLQDLLNGLTNRKSTINLDAIQGSPMFKDLQGAKDVEAEFRKKEADLISRFEAAQPGAKIGLPGKANEVAEVVKELYVLKSIYETLGSVTNATRPRISPADIRHLQSSDLGTKVNDMIQVVVQALQVTKKIDPMKARQMELAQAAGVPLGDKTFTVGGVLTGVGKQGNVPASAFTTEELQKIIGDVNATKELKGVYQGLGVEALKDELRRRNLGVSLDTKSQEVLASGFTEGSDKSLLTKRATEVGSLYTHDIHTEKLLEAIISRMDSIYVETVAPNTKVNADDDIRRKQIEETANNTFVGVSNLETIADNTEENVENTNKTNELLAKVADALEAIKELLSPSQTGQRRNNKSSGKEIYEEPFWEPMANTEYLYPAQESVGWGITSSSD